jgi:hypothetical protein
MVDSSVKKDELIGTKKIVDVPQNVESSADPIEKREAVAQEGLVEGSSNDQ